MTCPARAPVPPAPPPSGDRPRRRHGGRRPASAHRGAARRTLVGWLAALLALAGLLLAAVTWGPHLGRERIAGLIGGMLGRDVHIDRIDVSPFAGRVTVFGLRIAGAVPAETTLSVERAVLEVDPSPYLLRRLAVVRSVQLQAPSLRAIRTGPRRFDLTDLVDRLSAGPPAQRRALWRVERIEVTGGRIALDDRVVGRTATIDALRLSATGLTNRDEDRTTPATLDAAFTLNTRPVTIDARATPFADPPAADARVRIDALPLAELLPWIPLPADVRPTAGAIDLELRTAYGPAAQGASPTLRVEGAARLDGLRIDGADGHERVAVRSMALRLAPSRLVGGTVHVTSLEIDGPRITMGRHADGSLDWPAAATDARVAASPAASPAAAPAAPSVAAAQGSAPTALRIDRLSIEGGEASWQDAALAAPIALRLAAMRVDGEALLIDDLSRPAQARGAVRIATTADDATSLGVEAILDGSAGAASLVVGKLDLARWAPLAGPALRARVERGLIDARARVAWGGDGAGWAVTEAGAELSDLQVTHPGSGPARITKLAIAGLTVDPTARRIEAGTLTVDGARIAVRRARDGRIDLQDWYVPPAPAGAAAGSPAAGSATNTAAGAATPPAAGISAGAGGEAASPWTLLIRETRLDALDLDYEDAQIPREGRLPTVRLAGRVENLSLDPRERMPFEASAALPDGSRLAARGTLRPAPLEVDARLQLQRLVLTHFDPYLAPFVNATLASGQLWGSGRLRLTSSPDGALARIGFDGELSANEFRAIDRVSSDDFLRWTALAMPTVKVDWRTGRPADSLVEIGEVAFVDFYSRIILSPEGRLNLADIATDTTRPDAQRSLTAAPGRTPAGTPGQPTVAAASTSRADAPRPLVRIGTVRIASGNVNFTDLFIRPNYSAQLSQLVGVIEGIASDREAPSEVLITGRVDDDTPLEIVGKINPLAPRRFMDLRAVARGFDLPKLTPYSSRWAGYPIEKGKLTADVRYTIEGERLAAENRLTLNQLTFGDKVDSPDATSLPVRLAVSLLKDRDGNIALDLPISGTLSDPQFSVGGLLWRALGNLIVKVVSSPFTLLASIGGASAAELSHVDFAAGETRLDDEDRRRLDTLGRGLAERPGVSLEIAGYADPVSDRDAMQRERLENALRGAKLARMRQADPRAELPPLRGVRIDPAERPALLEHEWRAAGLDKAAGGQLPPPDALEQALLAHEPIAAEEVRQLAQQRAQAARDYLRDTRGISNERLYLLAPRIAEAGDTRPPSRADFAIR